MRKFIKKPSNLKKIKFNKPEILFILKRPKIPLFFVNIKKSFKP